MGERQPPRPIAPTYVPVAGGALLHLGAYRNGKPLYRFIPDLPYTIERIVARWNADGLLPDEPDATQPE
jgi:hypothetical protein